MSKLLGRAERRSLRPPYVDENRLGHFRLGALAYAREQHTDVDGAVLIVAGEVHAVRGLRPPAEFFELVPELFDVSEGRDLRVEVAAPVVRRDAGRRVAVPLDARVEHS